jgi:hypothetical protein
MGRLAPTCCRAFLGAMVMAAVAFGPTRVVPVSAAANDALPVVHGGPHDFDFEFGAWTVRMKRLVHPLAGSHTWIDYTGTSVVRPIWNGRANLAELDVQDLTTDARIDGLSVRLFDPVAHQWRVSFANATNGLLGVPTIGGFHDGRGEFYDREPFNGRTIAVRFVFSDITTDTFRFVQSFSADGGATWEANWMATFTRAGASTPMHAAARMPDGRRASLQQSEDAR